MIVTAEQTTGQHCTRRAACRLRGMRRCCPIDDQAFNVGLAEMIRLTIKTKAGALKATMQGHAIFENASGDLGTCK